LVAWVNRPNVRFASEATKSLHSSEMTLSADFVAEARCWLLRTVIPSL
jgi:hypothetical protein